MLIISSKDTIKLQDVYTVEKVRLLNKNFLMVTCSVRAGSGMHLEKTLVICARDNRLCESLHVSSLFKEDFIDFSETKKSPAKVSVKTRYKVRFALNGSSAANYKLQAKIHAERKSVKESAGNYVRNGIANLHFDTKQNIFYKYRESLSRTFAVFNSKTNAESKQYIKGVFPVVKLGDYKYYYIKGEWCEFSAPDYLSK
ncbi:hypothetical protein HYN43_027610 [Mucilaginibacter celer]|uniref:Uncharacterized protein n=1 Tax=Mucilaginibacter celer TaxID=2305508 RepID=A0A494VT76_9SPHI|nr:hypothetical protein HYN43_027610 [Mucilaginibacter celer]